MKANTKLLLRSLAALATTLILGCSSPSQPEPDNIPAAAPEAIMQADETYHSEELSAPEAQQKRSLEAPVEGARAEEDDDMLRLD